MTALARTATPVRARLTAAWRWPALVALAYLAIQAVVGPAAQVFPDTARYAQLALQYQGADPDQARLEATALVCQDQAEQALRISAAAVVPYIPDGGITARCMSEQATHLHPSGSPRYQELFASRPGYPAVVAVLAPVLGLKAALWVIPVTAVLAAGVGVWWLLRLAGLSPHLAAGGQGLLYVLPVGWWGSQMLTEGLVLAAAVAVVLGVVLLGRGRAGVGFLLLAAGFGVAVAVKYSTAVVLGGAVAAAAAVCWWIGAGDRRALLATAVGCAGAAGAVAVGSRVLGLPGLADSVQDMLTLHFTRPDVADPWLGLISANLGYWVRWPVLVPSNVGLVAGCVLAGWALWRWSPLVAAAVSAVAVAAFATVLVHPEPGELDRLYSLAWLLVAVGLPVAASVWVGPARRPAQHRRVAVA